MSERKPGTEGQKLSALGLIGAAIVLLAVIFVAVVFIYRVL
jgi:hypothetical protein